MIRYFLLLILSLGTLFIQAQNQDQSMELPYYNIPEAAKAPTGGAVLSRLLDGLGFRYRWATEGLRPEDLAYQPTEEARSAIQTLEHIHGLTVVILNTAQKKANVRPSPEKEWTFEALRKSTLLNIKEASDLFKVVEDGALLSYQITFKRGEQTSQIPLWNLINGPIADAINHVGQVVSFRRTSGNPQPSGVNVFMGTKKE